MWCILKIFAKVTSSRWLNALYGCLHVTINETSPRPLGGNESCVEEYSSKSFSDYCFGLKGRRKLKQQQNHPMHYLACFFWVKADGHLFSSVWKSWWFGARRIGSEVSKKWISKCISRVLPNSAKPVSPEGNQPRFFKGCQTYFY